MTPLQAGTQLGPYEILGSLGEGGMGHVYKARDTRLDRTVALKVLPKDFAGDAERLARFKREARAASALDHPGIVVLHDVSEQAGIHFLVMQYVRGRTLSDLMATGRLSLRQCLRFGVQLADALAAAHQQHIVHRDLKPSNVMVTEEDQVKVLDFGLAKRLASDEWTQLTRDGKDAVTEHGRVLGTLPYMSPQQALGEKVDHRSDIFSFGSVLYEMVTGQRPFVCDTAPALLVSILQDQPVPVGRLAPGTPTELERLIDRLLRKDPDRRFQSMADVRVELEEIRESVDSGSFLTTTRATTPQNRRRRWRMAAALAAAVAATSAVVWFAASRAQRSTTLTPPMPITSFIGDETFPAVAPDGRSVAFVWDGGDGGFTHIWVSLTEGGEPLQLTDVEASDTRPAWSPDGTELAFLRDREGEPGFDVLAVPAYGGAERRITWTSDDGGLDWSPDGEWLALLEGNTLEVQPAVVLHSLTTEERRPLAAHGADYFDQHPAFSPDGRFVAFNRVRVNAGMGHILVTDLGSGESRQLTPADSTYTVRGGLDWAPDSRSVVFTNAAGRFRNYLMRAPLSGGGAVRLTSGAEAVGVSVARAADVLVYAYQPEAQRDIWRAPGPMGDPSAAPANLIASTRLDWQGVYSPDGSQIAFASERSGTTEIWVADADGSNLRQLTNLVGTNFPRWSPDGTTILFGSWMGFCDVCLVDASGGRPRDLTEGEHDTALAGWSADGTWIYFQSKEDSDNWRIWKQPADGGAATRLTESFGLVPRGGIDGWVYYSSGGDVLRVPHESGPPETVLEGVGFEWDLWKNHLVYIERDQEAGSFLWTFDLHTGEQRRLGSVPGEDPWLTQISVSPDGRWVLFTHAGPAPSADLMRVEGFR